MEGGGRRQFQHINLRRTCARHGVTATLIINMGSISRWVVSFTIRPVYPMKEKVQCPLNRKFGAPWIGNLVRPKARQDVLKREKYGASTGTLTPDCPAHSLFHHAAKQQNQH
jgi:hypothetical protein